MEYHHVRISDENFSSFIQVFEASFDKKVDPKFFRKKFDTAYTGAEYVGFLAVESSTGEPAAFYGVYPTLAMVDNESRLVAQSGDTATHPSHRKRGLFRRLHDATISLCSEEGIHSVFGFPNRNSYPGFVKFGWSHERSAGSWTLKFESNLKDRVYRKMLPSRYWEDKSTMRSSAYLLAANLGRVDLDQSFVKRYSQNLVHIPRSERYLKYKLALNTHLLELSQGHAWISERDNVLEVGDIFALDDGKAFDEIVEFAKDSGFYALRLHLSHDRLLSHVRDKYSFELGDEIPLILNHVSGTFVDDDFVFSGGDFDTF